MQLLLPPELKHRIVELSSHDTLASLARTHTTYQIVAEQALYLRVSLYDPFVKCLETLATNSEKAGFVRFLTMEYIYFKNPHQRTISCLLNESLVNMHSLSDLRLRMHWSYYKMQGLMKSLNKILWSVMK
jgi:hypothetical protein